MDDRTISAVVEELSRALVGRVMGKVFQLTRASLAIDFRTHDSSYLFISAEPSAPRLYMIVRRVRDLEKQSLPSAQFALTLRKHLGSATLRALNKDEGDRIVRFHFDARDEMGNTQARTLIAQLTGRAANIFLVNEHGLILDALRQTRGDGQQVGDFYTPPPQPAAHLSSNTPLARGHFNTLSEAADDYYLRLEMERLFQARAAAARQRLRKEIAQRDKLRRHLLADRAAHGDAVEHKRIGDLLLSNIATAERRGSSVIVTDYYAPDTPRIELPLEEHVTLQEEAGRRFARYTKARRAAQEITTRLDQLEKELTTLHARQAELERIIEERDEAALSAFNGEPQQDARLPARKVKQRDESVPGARRYRSSDGYEILVGRAARDNDQLTFRLARPHDLWLHAADYPGSHVVVRNPNRTELPQRTIIEAAQLAAHFSQARRDAKVDVHYTQRKFISKPKGAAPGLVRLSSFRTITVEPRESVERA